MKQKSYKALKVIVGGLLMMTCLSSIILVPYVMGLIIDDLGVLYGSAPAFAASMFIGIGIAGVISLAGKWIG